MTLAQIILWSLVAAFVITVILSVMSYNKIWLFRRVSDDPQQSASVTRSRFILAFTVEIVAFIAFFLISALFIQPERAAGNDGSPKHLAGAYKVDELEAFYGPGIAKTIQYLLEDIDTVKDDVDNRRTTVWYAQTTAQLTLIVLGAISTLMVAVGNMPQYKGVAPWVIIPTTLVTIVSGVNAYYNYAEQHSKLGELRSTLAELQGKVIFDVNLDVATPDSRQIRQTAPDLYLSAIYGELNLVLTRYEQGRPLKEPPQGMASAAEAKS